MERELQRSWREFKKGKPGRRFQERFERNQKRHKKAFHMRALWFAIAFFLFLIGVVLTFIPGPAVLFFALAGGILADHSRRMARLLDWAELKSRQTWAWIAAWWKRAPGFARSGWLCLATLVMGVAAYLAYEILIPD